MKISKERKAFTLIELIVTIAIMGIVFALIYQTKDSNKELFPKATAKSNIQQDLRFAAEFISKDIRYARNATILPDIPVSFSNNLVYIYALGNNIKYVKNGVTKDILISDTSRTVNLIFTHSSTGTFNDGNTVSFSIKGSTTESYSLDSKVQILNLNNNTVNGDNGYCISYSLTDFDNNPPVVTSSNPIIVGSYSITHYNYDYIDTMTNSIDISGTMPTPFPITTFFIESDPGDVLAYSAASDNPDILSVKLDTSNRLNFTLNNSVTVDTYVSIILNAVDSYGGFASTKFGVTLKATSGNPTETIAFNSSLGNVSYFKDSGTKELDLTSYFTYNPSATVSFGVSKSDGTSMTVTNNKLQIPTTSATSDSGYNVTAVATLRKLDGTNISASGSINIIVKEAKIWFEKSDGTIIANSTTVTLSNKDTLTLKIKTNDSSLIISSSPLPTPVNSTAPFSLGNCDITYNDTTKIYTIDPNTGNATITIDAYIQGYENSPDAFKHISIIVKR